MKRGYEGVLNTEESILGIIVYEGPRGSKYGENGL